MEKENAKIAMSIDNAHLFFGGNHAVNGVSLSIEEGKINAIVGPNGSGKTTLFNIISGVYTPNAGGVYLKGENVTSLSDFQLCSPLRRNAISRTFQETPMFPYLTIKQHLQLAMNRKDENFFHSFFYKAASQRQAMQASLAEVGLNVPLEMEVANLSYGQKKLLSFALAIAKPHSILLIDEPVSGVNVSLRKTIAKMLLKMKANGETILLIEHDMNFVFSVADKVAVMDAGKKIFYGTPAEAKSNKEVLAAYLGG